MKIKLSQLSLHAIFWIACFSVAQPFTQSFAVAAEKEATKKITRPLEGPELDGPIVRPGKPKPEELAEVNTRSTDLAFGAFQRGYYLTALELALPRAESGDPAAQTLIAELYWKGLGVGRDPKKAVDWYQFAANYFPLRCY